MYIRYFRQGNHHACGHIRCVYTVLANPTYGGSKGAGKQNTLAVFSRFTFSQCFIQAFYCHVFGTCMGERILSGSDVTLQTIGDLLGGAPLV